MRLLDVFRLGMQDFDLEGLLSGDEVMVFGVGVLGVACAFFFFFFWGCFGGGVFQFFWGDFLDLGVGGFFATSIFADLRTFRTRFDEEGRCRDGTVVYLVGGLWH